MPSKKRRNTAEKKGQSSGGSISKQPRTAQTQANFSPELTRSTEFWFPDGNINLVAGKVAFRVHKSVLADNSLTFREMFLGDCSLHPGTTFDGCPLVYLFETEDEIEQLLRVIYRARSHFRPDKEIELNVVETLLRLSHVYKIEDLRADALARMRMHFPDTFDAWESLEQGLHSLVLPSSEIDIVVAVNLARLFPESSMLPIALYRCAQLDVKWLLPANPPRTRPMERLSGEDLERCVEARVTLTRENIRAAYRIYEGKPVSGCERPEECSVALKAHWRVYKKVMRQDALTLRGTELESLALAKEICQACCHELKARDREQRERIWRRLPKILGVDAPAWHEETTAEGLSDAVDLDVKRVPM